MCEEKFICPDRLFPKTDCRHFKGDVPCKPHKEHGFCCARCPHYSASGEKILIIKLGAMGDVIRTTPLLRKLREVHPDAEISWLTNYPEAVPGAVDRVYKYSTESVVALLAVSFDIVYNLDKDLQVASLTNLIKADVKKGFHLKDGKCAPIDESARHKWLTGLSDVLNKENTKSYPQEMFEICGYSFNGEEYILDPPVEANVTPFKKKKFMVGLNTGCGDRWRTRLWPEEYWIELANRLMALGVDVMFIGGPAEDEKNRRLARAAGCAYPGHFPLQSFISIVNQCDLVVTAVTMALHIAIGLRKKIVLMNNIFNRHEFELYGLGTILEPELDCLCCYKTSCERECMRLITPQKVLAAVRDLLLGKDALVRKESISLIFPAYNEEGNIAGALEQAFRELPNHTKDWEVIVVNDGSADRTGQILEETKVRHPNLRPIHHPVNKGYGAALKSGISAAKKDLIFFCDSDLQFDLTEIQKLLRHIDEYDIVAGYREHRQDPLYRRVNAFGWNMLVRMLLGIRVRDIDCAFKLFRHRVFDAVRVDAVGAMVNTDILSQAINAGFTIKEVPVTHYPRTRGTQTGAKFSVILKAFRELIKLYRKLNAKPRQAGPRVRKIVVQKGAQSPLQETIKREKRAGQSRGPEA